VVKMKILFNLILLMLLLSSAASAQSYINIISENNDTFNAVLVEKDGKWLHVLKVAGADVEVLESFQVMTGKMNGDKFFQGDEKTPEGLYYVTGFLSPEKLKSMYGDVGKQYGTGAYPLSYPNLKDRLNGKTGGGIWLHGVDPEREELFTKGCVAFENENLDKMADYIKIGTPVLITKEGIQGSPEEVRAHFEKAKNMVNEYISAWEDNDFEKYKSFYNKKFKDTGRRELPDYLEYKKMLMDFYPYRKIDTDNFRIFYQNEDEAVAEFDQYYCAPNVQSFGRKRYYLENESGGLKISAEEFIPKNSADHVRTEVHDFLLNWKLAWESLDIEKYISFYSDKFSARGFDLQKWKDDKAGKFEGLNDVKVIIENIKYTAESPVRYTVEFRQKYTGDEYSDIGIKTLRLEGCPGDFSITAEYWRAE